MSHPALRNPLLWAWLGIALAAGFLLWLLAPILTPFLFAAILAYILDPLVERLTRRRVPRLLAVIVVLLAALALVVALVFVLVPLFNKELRLLIEKLPGFVAWTNEQLAPWLKQRFDVEFRLELDTVRQLVRGMLAGDEQIVQRLLASLTTGGSALIAFLVNIVLIPVVLFYLLRDWNLLLARMDRLIPRRIHERARRILREIDAVLAEFLRAQVIVIVVMSVYYVGALSLARLEFALPIGIVTGLLVFIPYVGMLTGLVLATIAALMQFGAAPGVLWVWLGFGIGQALEGMAVTPLLIGERVGLHPVAVIFALLAFGQVFGFFGVLLALPASAALLVGLRQLRAAYLAGPLYGGGR